MLKKLSYAALAITGANRCSTKKKKLRKLFHFLKLFEEFTKLFL